MIGMLFGKQEEHSNIFRLLMKHTEPVEKPKVEKKVEVEIPIEPVITYGRNGIPSEYSDKETAARNLYRHSVGDRFRIGHQTYIINKMPRIDLTKKYLPMFLLLQNEFVVET